MRPTRHPVLLLLLALLSPAAVWGWGMLGHRTTALLATRFLSRPAGRQIRALLKPQSLVTASTWADYYAHTPQGRYSAPWHWIDARDSPPHACGIDLSRDCDDGSSDSSSPGRGCIVSAIANHTARVRDPSLPRTERQMSLKWIVHFVGDVHQPLHTEDLLRGGNGLNVAFDGRPTSLHHVWDTSVAERRVGGNSVRDAVRWADALHADIADGRRWGPRVPAAWGACLDPSRGSACALAWAQETNAWMCSYVLPPTYPAGFAGSELNGSYYDGAVDVVELQVARAGWRLAMWLNAVFADPDDSDPESWASWLARTLGVAGDL